MIRTGPSPDEIELARICALPVQVSMDAEDLEIFNATKMLATAYDEGKRLWNTQAAAIQAYIENDGGFFSIAVGWGKTLISLMIANEAREKKIRKSLLLIPAQVTGQLWNRDIKWARKQVPMAVNFYMLGGRTRAARAAIAESNRPGCYILPYSLLSQTDAMSLLEKIDPGLVIADEVHYLKNPRTARGKRVLSFLRAKTPQFVGMSGTITTKTINDYAHLIGLALKEKSPLPRSRNMSYFWAQTLGAHALELEPQTAYALKPLVRWAERMMPGEVFQEDLESYRRAYRLRWTSAPGVVATGDNEIGVSLTISNLPVPAPEEREGFEDLLIHMDQVKRNYLTPNGDEIEHAMLGYKWLYELSAGFYNELTWPTEAQVAAHGSKRPVEDLARAKAHHAAAQFYHRDLRDYFKTSPPGLDTPREVGRSISMHGGRFVGAELAQLYHDMNVLEFLGMPERISSAHRVSDFKINHAVEWGKNHPEGGILWVYHIELGKWLVEALAKAGLNPLHCPAGANEAIGDPRNANRLVVASIQAHGVAKNLQHFKDQVFVQWPRGAAEAEQAIGRTHRNGQEADEMIVHTMRTLAFDDIDFAATLNDAVYRSQTTGARDKIVYCVHDPLPTIFSPEFLREQGATVAVLDEPQRQMLRDLFDWRGV